MSLAREVQVKFRMTRQERELLEEKMTLAGTANMGAYLRKMAIDGYVLRLDLPAEPDGGIEEHGVSLCPPSDTRAVASAARST